MLGLWTSFVTFHCSWPDSVFFSAMVVKEMKNVFNSVSTCCIRNRYLCRNVKRLDFVAGNQVSESDHKKFNYFPIFDCSNYKVQGLLSKCWGNPLLHFDCCRLFWREMPRQFHFSCRKELSQRWVPPTYCFWPRWLLLCWKWWCLFLCTHACILLLVLQYIMPSMTLTKTFVPLRSISASYRQRWIISYRSSYIIVGDAILLSLCSVACTRFIDVTLKKTASMVWEDFWWRKSAVWWHL